MINYNMALAESIKAAVLELHRTLLINEGYRRLTLFSERLESLERGQQSKIAVGQDWFPVCDGLQESDDFQVARDDLCDACGTPLGDMLVVNVVSAFDEDQRRLWTVTYSLRHGNLIYSVSARLSEWSEPVVRMLGWPFERNPQEDEDDEGIEELAEEIRDQAIQRLQHLIYEQVTKMHERHLASGYSRQKIAYERFILAAESQGYMTSGVERFQVASTQEAFGQTVDPVDTEEAFRETWTVPLAQMELLTAEYFPTEDGLDRWYVVYQLNAMAITMNVFVKFYPHRRPQVEIVSS